VAVIALFVHVIVAITNPVWGLEEIYLEGGGFYRGAFRLSRNKLDVVNSPSFRMTTTFSGTETLADFYDEPLSDNDNNNW
jgi:hypothetical protein